MIYLAYYAKILRTTLNEQNIYDFKDWEIYVGEKPTYMLRILKY